MNLLYRQIWALVRKNWLLICLRRPVSTFFRALVLPLVVILVLAYSKNFFASSEHWGISAAHNVSLSMLPVDSLTLPQLRSLEESLAVGQNHDIVGFVHNGMKGGEVSSVIDILTQRISAAGKTIKLYDDTRDLALQCRTDDKGVTPCYGAVEFFSSPTEGSSFSTEGSWNYTIRGSSSGSVDIRTTNNSSERDLLPLQRAVDQEIISRSRSVDEKERLADLEVISFTNEDQSALTNSRTANYLSLSIYIFGPLFTFTLVEIVYHITSFVSRERELGKPAVLLLSARSH